MTKRINMRMLVVIFTFVASFVPVLLASAATIEIGDYVQMGTYYGEPILWRCVDIDDNGPLMLSDKIICLKPFDAELSSNTTTGSHSRRSYESNYWGDSNMRSWLNSSASAGNVNWLCGNPPIDDEVYDNAYADEAGFLTNFTQEELNAVKSVSQKSLLSYPEYDAGMATTGTQQHYYDSDIDEVVQNYDTAYAEYVTDKMFLLDVKQVNAVYNNSDILGDDYYIGEPTAQCVANSEYTSSSFSVGEKWNYWLRSPQSYSTSYVRYVLSAGYVYSNNAYSGTRGVRPAFYLNVPSFSVISGEGTESNPYVGYGLGSGGESGIPDYQTQILGMSEVEDKYIINSVAMNNINEKVGCVIYSAVYSEDGMLKGCSSVNVDIEANNYTVVDVSVSCDIECGDVVKTFMWSEEMSPFAKTAELVIE